MLSVSYAIKIVDEGVEEATFLATSLDGTLKAVEEKFSQSDEFFRFVNSDGSNTFWSKNNELNIKSPSGCENFHLRAEDDDQTHFELVSACSDEERIEFNDGKLHNFRLVDAPIIH